jgi:putative SOS response-associated peptidase YedK
MAPEAVLPGSPTGGAMFTPMCSRARLSSDVSEIKLVFSIPPARPAPNVAPSWNLAPTDPTPIVYRDARDGGRRLEVMRWGLIPYWAKDIKIGFSTINARAEEVDTKPAFREAFRQRRCVAQPVSPSNFPRSLYR